MSVKTEFFVYDQPNRQMIGPFPTEEIAALVGHPIACPVSTMVKKRSPWAYVLSELKCRRCNELVGSGVGCDFCNGFKTYANDMRDTAEA